MRIYDEEADRSLGHLTLLLTTEEAQELRDDLDRLLQATPGEDHYHVSNDNEDKALMVATYGKDLSQFGKRLQRLITEDA